MPATADYDIGTPPFALNMWQQTTKNYEDAFHHQVMDAYTMGVQEGVKKAADFAERAFLEGLKENLKKAMDIGSGLLAEVSKDFKIEVEDMFLKAESPENFKIVFCTTIGFFIIQKTAVNSQRRSSKRDRTTATRTSESIL